MHTVERSLPAERVNDRLGDVGSHGDKVSLHRGQRRGVAVDPLHTIGARLGLRDIELAGRRIDTGHLETAVGEKQRERTGSAAEVQNPAGAQPLSDGRVDIEVAAVGVERVIDRDQSRVLEDVVSHASTISRSASDLRHSIPDADRLALHEIGPAPFGPNGTASAWCVSTQALYCLRVRRAAGHGNGSPHEGVDLGEPTSGRRPQ